MVCGTRSKDQSIICITLDSDSDDQGTPKPAETNESSILKQKQDKIEDLQIEVEDLKDKLNEKTELIDLYKKNNDDHEAIENELKKAVKELQKLLNETVDQCDILLMEKEKENETLKLQIKTMHEDGYYQNGLGETSQSIEARGRELAVVNASEDLNKNFKLRELYAELDCSRQQITELQRINRTLVVEQSHALRWEYKRMRDEIKEKDNEIIKWKNSSLEMEIEILRKELTASKANEVRWRQLADRWEEEALKPKDNAHGSNLNTQDEDADFNMTDATKIKSNEAFEKISDPPAEYNQANEGLRTSDQEHTNEMEVHSSYVEELERQKDDLRKCKEELQSANEKLNELQGEKDYEQIIFKKEIDEFAAELQYQKDYAQIILRKEILELAAEIECLYETLDAVANASFETFTT